MRIATNKILAAWFSCAALLAGCSGGGGNTPPAATDTTPNQFTFTDQSDNAPSTATTSAPVSITGINAPAAIVVTGGTYSVGCTANFIGTAGTIGNNQTVCVRHTSAAAPSTPTNTILTVGGVSDTFTSTTAAAGGADTTPNAFSFIDQTNVATGMPITSAAVNITGITAPAPVSVTGGTYSVGCTGTFTSSNGTIGNNQSVCVRQLSAATPNTTTNTILTIGGVSDTFTTTTAAGGSTDTVPDQFTFTDQPGVATNTVITSAAVTIMGITAPATVTVTGGTYSINGGAFTAANGVINNGNTVQVRHTSAATASTPTNTTLTIGGVSDTFTSTTAAPVVVEKGLLPFLTGTGAVRLLDPAAMFSGTNPTTVDSGLAPPATGNNCNDCFDQAQTFVTGNISGTNVSNIHAARLAYVKRGAGNTAGGSVFKVNLTQGADNTPVQISSVTDACRIIRSETTDFANIDNSAVVIERAGGGSCATPNNVATVIRLNSATSSAGTNITLALDAGNPIHALNNAAGAIDGFVSFESTATKPNLVRRDAALANPPTLLLALEQTTGANIESTDLTHLFVTATPVEDALKLFRIETDGSTLSSVTLSPVLYTFTGFNAGNPIQRGLHDATNLYLSDKNLLLRIPLNATAEYVNPPTNTIKTAVVITTMSCEAPTQTSDPCLRIGNRVLDTSTTPGRVVFEAQDDSISVAGGVFSAATDGSTPTGTLLARNPDPEPPLTDAGAFADLLTAAHGLAYITLNNHGPDPEPDALKISTAGPANSGTKILSAYWAGLSRATSFDLATDFDVPTQFIFLATRLVDTDTRTKTDTIHVVNPTDGVTGISLGFIDNTAESETTAISINGLGRYVLARVEISRGGVVDDDVYFLDALMAGSLRLLTPASTGNDIPLTGN